MKWRKMSVNDFRVLINSIEGIWTNIQEIKNETGYATNTIRRYANKYGFLSKLSKDKYWIIFIHIPQKEYS